MNLRVLLRHVVALAAVRHHQTVLELAIGEISPYGCAGVATAGLGRIGEPLGTIHRQGFQAGFEIFAGKSILETADDEANGIGVVERDVSIAIVNALVDITPLAVVACFQLGIEADVIIDLAVESQTVSAQEELAGASGIGSRRVATVLSPYLDGVAERQITLVVESDRRASQRRACSNPPREARRLAAGPPRSGSSCSCLFSCSSSSPPWSHL